ncbi:quinone oxidoreductase PIG3 isoform X2 [Bombina bombina]|nr:quinone oxidoreductase PIG3 isoform X2 [Bombina bombina]XP_053565603.1 quinone oxidoreductase PIG3 isoform X2 [Bombina bombina]XP_053565604.1 quinone oxidoreductase PIG3 isoform X2 [Bombina bombina]XP_053565605.1 quinone oxidoreductase PIG3 isoform X2 [Bombina bombina]
MLAAFFDAPGGPENLYIKEVAKPVPKAGEVLIEVQASALNRADLLQRRGKYSPPPGASDILGLEVAGTVVGLGPASDGRWKIGDPVMALLSGGGNAQYAATPVGHIMPIPSGLGATEAAAIPEAWLTAFQLLHFVGKVQKGETVLIHAGASGVGTAAIQLCKLAGAIPIVTAGSAEKLQITQKLGAAAGFNYKEEDFGTKCLDFTNNVGVDIILDCIGASHWEKNLHCLNMDGRWVVYGLMGSSEIHGDLLAKLLWKRGSLLGSLLRSHSSKYKEELVKAFTEQALPHFTPGGPIHLHPIVDSIYPLERISDAHQRMEDNKNTGKIVLQIPQ